MAGEKLADIFVELGLSTNKFNAGLDQTKSKLTGFFGNINQLFNPSTLVSGGLVAAFIQTMHAAEDSIQSVKKLDFAVRSFGDAAGQTKADILATSDAISKITNFDDDAINSATATLLEFGNVSGSTFKQAVQTMVDLGARTGDLEGAARSLGAALSHPAEGVSQLRRQFRAFSPAVAESVKELAEMGRVAEAQTLILNELNKVVGGTAVTMASKWEMAKGAFGELSETIGKESRPLTEDFFDIAKGVANWTQEMIKSGKVADTLFSFGRIGPGIISAQKAESNKAKENAEKGRNKFGSEADKAESDRLAKAETDRIAFEEKRITHATERGKILTKIEADTTDGILGERKRLANQLKDQAESLTKTGATPEEIAAKAQETTGKFERDLAKQRKQSLLSIEAETTTGVASERAKFEAQLEQRLESMRKIFDDERVLIQAESQMRQKFEADLAKQQRQAGLSIQSQVTEGFTSRMAGGLAQRAGIVEETRNLFGDEAATQAGKMFTEKFNNQLTKDRKSFDLSQLAFGGEGQAYNDPRAAKFEALIEKTRSMREQAKELYSGDDLEKQNQIITRNAQASADKIARDEQTPQFVGILDFAKRLTLGSMKTKSDQYLSDVVNILRNEGIAVKGGGLG